MNVYLMIYTKKENSTARPTITGITPFSGTLRDSCSIINPFIGFDLGQNTTPTANYAYISDFSRYYFIENWTWERGIWWAEMAVDVLATWRTEIGDSTQYILRSADTWNGQIIDTLYPLTNHHSYAYELITNNWSGTGPGSGYYVIGIISGDTAAIGATAYYVFSPSNFRLFMQSLMSSVSYTNIDFTSGEISEEFFKSLFNPFQYIVSAMWVPMAPPMGAQVVSVPVGWWSISATASLLTGSYMYSNHTVTVPHHPLATTRGAYLNGAPFSRYALYYEPFGLMELDPNMLTNATSINVNIFIDAVTGVGECKVGALDSIDFCAVATAQVGVPVQLAQVSQDILGAGVSLVNGVSSIAGGLGSALTGNIVGGISGAISGAVSGIASAAESIVPHVSTSGANGSFGCFTQASFLLADFWGIANEDRTHRGRPLCSAAQVSTLDGYQLISDPSIAISGTDEENRRIKNYMATGFYWE